MAGAKSLPKDERHQVRHDPPFWEKVVALTGLLMFVVLLGYLLYEAIAGNHSPPDIVVEVVEIHSSGDDFLVTFRAINRGGETAQNVVINGEIRHWGIVVDSAQSTLDFIPPESSRQGGLFFSRDPRDGELRLVPAGYTRP